ncbi:hypothetical protein [Zymobacter sp. IVIA_12111.31 C1]|uniref:hypothetical protein n=1 Tax=Zymobacter sp. IVIA_12111.31 C1 TaxID=3394854 RepID=UPI0039C01BD1
MKITDAPALITTPFAQNGTRNDIPATGDGLGTGRASLATGFPDETMKPITAGGVPPFGADFNGILYALSNAARFYGAGGHYKFNADFASKIGGYPMGATVQASDNMGHWLNVVESNSTDPESGLSTGWLPLADHNGTATVTLTGNTTLTPLQAAKANLRFTGAPTGNVTVTFPAWTKRYSIINDCTGNQSIICTTGNGESISIKNGAKYEVGCDGNNLTIATVNASQVFAEPNKNVSALDAPTVQQIINALGSAAAHSASDFDAAGNADAVKKLCVLKDYISYAGCVGGDGTDPYFMLAATGGLIRLATREFARQQADDLKGSLGSAAYKSSGDFDAIGEADKVNKELQDYKTEVQNSYVNRDFVKTLGLLNGRPYVRALDDVITQLADTDDLDWLRANLVYRDGIAVLGKLSDGTLYVKDSSSNIDVVVKKTELSDGAYMWKSSAGVDGLVGNAKEVMTTAQGVELRNMTVRKVRLGQPISYDMQSNTVYSQSGHVISSLRITGAVDGSMDSITLRPIQYLINGTWYTVEQV